MTPDEIPADLKAILDKAAGEEHSEEGPVMACLADILTAYRRTLSGEFLGLQDQRIAQLYGDIKRLQAHARACEIHAERTDADRADAESRAAHAEAKHLGAESRYLRMVADTRVPLDYGKINMIRDDEGRLKIERADAYIGVSVVQLSNRMHDLDDDVMIINREGYLVFLGTVTYQPIGFAENGKIVVCRMIR